MENVSDLGQHEGAGRHCSSCGAAAAESARLCPACGRALAGASESADITNWVGAGWALFARNIPVAVAIPLVLFALVFGSLLVSYFGVILTAMLSDHKSGPPTPMLVAMGAL